MSAARFLRPGRRAVAALTGAAFAATLTAASGAVSAAPPQIPVRGQVAFCGDQLVSPDGGVLRLDTTCALTLQIEWPQPMKSAYLEFSTDGGATWEKDALPLPFPVVAAGTVSGVGFAACDALLPVAVPFLVRAHGFLARVEQGSLFSAPFPAQLMLDC